MQVAVLLELGAWTPLSARRGNNVPLALGGLPLSSTKLSGYQATGLQQSFSLSYYLNPIITVALCTIKSRPNEHCIQYLQPEIGPSSDRDRDLSKTNECS